MLLLRLNLMIMRMMEFLAIPTDDRSDVIEMTGDIVFKKIVALDCCSHN